MQEFTSGAMTPPPQSRGDDFAEQLATRLSATVAGIAAAAAVAYALVAIFLPASHRALASVFCALLASGCWLLYRNPFGLARGARTLLLGAGVAATVAANAISLGLGVRSGGFAFLPILVCVVAVLGGPRPARRLAGSYALLILVVAVAERLGWFAIAPGVAAYPLALASVTQWVVLVAGVVVGQMLGRVIERATQQAQSRERRFAGLLAIAADWYWELDEHFCATHLVETLGGRRVAQDKFIGKPPWTVSNFGLDADELDEYIANFEAHRPYANRLLHRRGRDGRSIWLSESGRPRFDGHGKFIGYWGVTRDVTIEHEAEVARLAAEARYRELFERSPTPLVLIRDGAAFDANIAAAALFGVADKTALIGRRMLDFFVPDDGSRQRGAVLAQALQVLPAGESTPQSMFTLQTADGHRRVVQVSSVKVDSAGGPAVMSIFIDETERLRAEAARARSEALMTHVVATSPDIITLSELATGRYLMVSDAFAKTTGWSREEAIGRTAKEITVWPDLDARQRFVDDLIAQGQVRERLMQFKDRQDQPFLVIVSAVRFALEGCDYVALTGRDVTALERERLEREAILDNASIGIALTRERVFQLVNPALEAMLGWPRGALVGQLAAVVWPGAAAFAEIAEFVTPRLDRGEAVDIERLMARRDGSTVWCRLQARAIDPTHPAKGGRIWIVEDITDRRASEAALASAIEAAEAANRAKSAFLANTSHEIRTPLNGLVGLARLARQPGLDAERRDRYLAQIDESAKTLAGVISDILDLSKIEAGKLSLEAVNFGLYTLLESIEQGYSALAEARGLTLTMVVRKGVPRRVRGDPARLRQVLSNFLGNALKFTERGGVSVEVRPASAERLRFEVRDTGPGLTAAAQARLFTPFTQADESTTRRYGGTGLGLSICRELAELMGGEVGVVSEPGQGACFWTELPLPASDGTGPESGFDALTDEASPLTGLRVLVAEDNAVNMIIAVAMLEQWGVEVSQAGDGAQAVAAVDAQAAAGTPFDLVLMDVQMPVQGGYDATRALRQRYSAAQLPIIALTAAALTSERDEALACGMNDFLTKPIDAQRLHDTLLQWRQTSRT